MVLAILPHYLALVAPKLLVSLLSRLVACSARIVADKQTRKHTDTQNDYCNPRCACAPRVNDLPRVGLEPTTLYTLDRTLYQLSYRGSTAGWAQISHLIVHLMNRLTIDSAHAYTYTHVPYMRVLVCTCIYMYVCYVCLRVCMYGTCMHVQYMHV